MNQIEKLKLMKKLENILTLSNIMDIVKWNFKNNQEIFWFLNQGSVI